MSLSTKALIRLGQAVTDAGVGKEIATAINLGSGLMAASSHAVVMVVVDAAASATLAGLLIGDLVIDVTTVANNTTAQVPVTVVNTIAFTPTVHDVLVVLRPVPTITTPTVSL